MESADKVIASDLLAAEVVLENVTCSVSDVHTTNDIVIVQTADADIQWSLLTDCHFSIEQFVNNAEAVKYYTVFDDYAQFRFFLALLGSSATQLKYQCCSVSVPDQLFITMMKLRQAKD